MNKKTKKALDGSIKKWEKILAGKIADKGDENCPLCKIFCKFDVNYSYKCDGCPVKDKTGRNLCCGTPYDDWDYSDVLLEDCKEDYIFFKKQASAELKFLKSLREGD
jgi:hypothetical protein